MLTCVLVLGLGLRPYVAFDTFHNSWDMTSKEAIQLIYLNLYICAYNISYLGIMKEAILFMLLLLEPVDSDAPSILVNHAPSILCQPCT